MPNDSHVTPLAPEGISEITDQDGTLTEELDSQALESFASRSKYIHERTKLLAAYYRGHPFEDFRITA
ncbi:MAG: hypothetical protein WC773_03015 [Patescibacteria group bacterium]|jgi:hypothetical protein